MVKFMTFLTITLLSSAALAINMNPNAGSANATGAVSPNIVNRTTMPGAIPTTKKPHLNPRVAHPTVNEYINQ